MSSVSSYLFNNAGRIGTDATDQSQRNVYNTRFTNHTLSNYFSDKMSTSHVNFATNQPAVMFSGMARGTGLIGSAVDTESILKLKTEQDHAVEKLQLFQRPFATVPYLGRGSCDPSIESQLLLGEMVSDKKSVSTIMDKSFSQYALYPTDKKMEERVTNAANNVEEAALDGWVRGGMTTREMSNNDIMKKNNRPNASF
jgi:hypothetical protein